MIKKQIQLEVNGKEAAQEVEKVNKALLETNETAGDLGKTIDKTSDDLEDAGKKGKKGFSAIGAGVKALAVSFKALGIGLLVSAFTTFLEIAKQNQKVIDVLNTAFEFTSLLFNDLIQLAVDLSGGLMDAFKNPKQALDDFVNLVKDGLINRFNELVETLGFVARGIGQLFLGNFKLAGEAFKEAGKQAVDVITGTDDSLEKVKDTIVDYTKETYNAAKGIVELNKVAEKSESLNRGLIESYDIQAESLRQIRDDDRKTIGERIEANNKLKEVLELQEKAMKANANNILAAAQAQYDKNASDENAIALQEAKNELLGIEAQVNGFKSEQMTNEAALQRELKELALSKSEAELEASEILKTANVEAITGTEERIMAQMALEQELYNNQKALLDKRLEDEKEGTQAYQDILNERLLLDANNTANQRKLSKELSDYKKTLDKETNTTLKANRSSFFSGRHP